MTSFNADDIKCSGLSQPVGKDCRKLMQSMPASKDYFMFGKAGNPGVDVDIPWELTTRDTLGCTLFLNIEGSPERERWYSIWRQAAAIEKLCVQKGKPGVAYGLGLHGGLIDLDMTF
ncbi:hypothetical protein ACLMJK_007064 [Lecanora helva]